MQDELLPARALIDDELERLCESDALRRSPSHVRLLRYLVERAVDRDARSLTETAIAIAVFRRDPAIYDPQIDPIVRVTVSRLRTRLAACYALPLAERRLRILIPRGRYAPAFVVDDAPGRSKVRVAVLAMRNASGSARNEALCRAFERQLANAVAFPGRTVVVAHSRTRDDAASRRLLEVGRRLGAEALLEPVLTRDPDGELRVTVRLVDMLDGHVRWTETATTEQARPGPLRERLVTRTLARLRPGPAAGD